MRFKTALLRLACWQAGYTLVEVLIVVAISVILIGIGLASYGRFDRVRKIEQASLDFGMYLREIQKRADGGGKPAGCTGGLNGFQVSVTTPASHSVLFANCSSSIPEGSRFLRNATEFSDDFTVIFRTLGLGVDVSDGSTHITDANSTASYQVVVESGGAITVEKI